MMTTEYRCPSMVDDFVSHESMSVLGYCISSLKEGYRATCYAFSMDQRNV